MLKQGDERTLIRSVLVRIRSSTGPVALDSDRTLAELKRQIAAGLPVDVVLLELEPTATAAARAEAFAKNVQAIYPDLRILAIRVSIDARLGSSASKCSAQSHIAKPSSGDASAKTQPAVRQKPGGTLQTPAPRRRLPEGSADAAQLWHAELSPREFEVLQQLVADQLIKTIALDLGLSIKTVSTHKTRLMAKLGVKNNAELIRLTSHHGMR